MTESELVEGICPGNEKLEFKPFGVAIAKQFQSMVSSGLFRVEIEKDELWSTYLASFPAGSNAIYKTRTEHDCSCCRHFVRTLGGVVTIADGKLVTIWDCTAEGAYQSVADAMAALVKGKPIDNIFLHSEKTVGQALSRQLLEDKSVVTFDHFNVNLPDAAYLAGPAIGPALADRRSTHDVMLRSLVELSDDAIDSVLDLIAQNSLYRGEENAFALNEFRKLKAEVSRAASKDLFVWSRIGSVPQSVSRIRNTAIGSLLVDLSEGKDLDEAVKSFEAKVAPANYKRPTALVTKAMIAKAQAKVEELGFTSALERRYATIEDITVNNVLFADRTALKAMNVFDAIASTVPDTGKHLDKVEGIGIEEFLSKIIPRAESLEVLFENRHAGNLVSLIAPVDPTAKGMFKWPNNFSWSYAGEFADSIKERVKRAGGSVVGDLCCRLAWDYSDDLDFHMTEPNGFEIYYPVRRQSSPSGGILDLDANGGDGQRPDPAENIFYTERSRMRDGVYLLAVNNYNRRSAGQGFEVEIEFDGQVHRISYANVLKTGETIAVAKIKKTNGVFEIIESLPSSKTSKTVWGIPTENFRRVNVAMLSPNHWDQRAVGNRHYFFMLDGCQNEGKARGFFNEYLTEELTPHRKVFEVVGAKIKTEESDRQLSGLGFSSTQRNHLLCRVKGAFTRTVKITF